MAAAVISPKIIQRIIGPFDRGRYRASAAYFAQRRAGCTLGVLATEWLDLL